MFRCRFRLSCCDVYSYEQKAVNLPGWLFSSAILTFSFQIVPATSGVMKALTGGALARLRRYRKAAWTCAGLFWSWIIRPCASGILLTADPGVLASLVTPTYSEWSVTPMKSIGVSIAM